MKALVGLPRFVYAVHATDDGLGHLCPVKQNVGKRVTHSMDFRIAETEGQPHLEWAREGLATASAGLTIQAGKTRGGCTDDLKTLLPREWQESAGIKGKLLAIGYGLATITRAAAQLALTGELQQDRRGRLTYWRMVRQEARP